MRCYSCGTENEYESSFCTQCGRNLKPVNFSDTEENRSEFTQSIILILLVVLVIVLSFQTASTMSLLDHEYLFNGLLIAISVVFLFLGWPGFVLLLKWKPRIKPILLILTGAPLLAVVVIFVSEFLNNALEIKSIDYIEAFKLFTDNSYLYGLVFIAAVPGLVEETLFRGLLFNYLLRFTRPKNVILITGILFSFVHFSFIAILWLFPIGLILGYLRFRYRTIWYAVLFHMMYNASVFILEPYLS